MCFTYQPIAIQQFSNPIYTFPLSHTMNQPWDIISLHTYHNLLRFKMNSSLVWPIVLTNHEPERVLIIVEHVDAHCSSMCFARNLIVLLSARVLLLSTTESVASESFHYRHAQPQFTWTDSTTSKVLSPSWITRSMSKMRDCMKLSENVIFNMFTATVENTLNWN